MIFSSQVGIIVDNKIREHKWDVRLLQMAQLVAAWSKDPSTQVGAVIADDSHRIVGVGYNGFPRGMCDGAKLYNNREIKYERVIHGEINALLNANKSVEGCTLYEVPFFSCSRCVVQVIQSGIRRIVFPYHDPDSRMGEAQKRWQASIDIALGMCEEVGIECTPVYWSDVLR
jgi:dCMP deaminase